MPDQPDQPVQSTQPRPDRQRQVVVVVVAIVGAVLAYFIAAAVIPRWWAQRVASVVDGSLTTGVFYGLFIGFTFTVVPLLLALAVFRWRRRSRTWKGWLGWLVVIVVLAAPNLMTLGIVLGISDAAHAGDRILDVEGPGFRLWSLVGAIAAAAAVLGVVALLRSRRASRRRATRLDEQLRSRDQGGDDG